MISSVLELRPLARRVEITDDELAVELADGRRISAPLVWFPRLLAADAAERQNWELLGDGEGIHWPSIDEDLSVAGLLAGARSHSRPLKRAG
ncbi:MAG: DUF2442 domain-containing protein [Thermoanaerobaculia bacterium]